MSIVNIIRYNYLLYFLWFSLHIRETYFLEPSFFFGNIYSDRLQGVPSQWGG